MANRLRSLNPVEFARRLKDDCSTSDKSYVWFLGAGCSISSGIPSAATLVKEHWLPRLKDFRAPEREDFDKWVKEELPDFDTSNPALSYGEVLRKLFLLPEDQHREIERLCDGKFPDFGYAVLSTLMIVKSGKFNIVITTNFDDLLTDSFSLFHQTRPLVIGHDSLAGFIQTTRTRPIIIKIHGDYRLTPKSTVYETKSIEQNIEQGIKNLLDERGLIFLGYGGNDKGIYQMLQKLPNDALPFGVFWVSGTEPSGIIRPWLENQKAFWVKCQDFNEFMLLMKDSFQLPDPDRRFFDQAIEKYFDTINSLYEKFENENKRTKSSKAIETALARVMENATGWRNFYLLARSYEHSNKEKANTLYKEGIEKYPESIGLLLNYAIFLRRVICNLDEALLLLQKALVLDPERIDVLKEIAIVSNHLEQYESSLHYYTQILRINTKDYDSYLFRGDNYIKLNNKQLAFDDYHKAIELDPVNPRGASHIAFAHFKLGDFVNALAEINKSIELDPTINSSYISRSIIYANLGKFDEAIDDINRILEKNPRDAVACYNCACIYALQNEINLACEWLRKAINYEKKYFKKAISDSDFDGIRNSLIFTKLISEYEAKENPPLTK